MAESTGISWCDATFNPWVGCTKISPGCKHCYAETMVTGRMGRRNTWGPTGIRERTSASNWKKPLRWNHLAADGLLPDGTENPDGHRPRVFCASLADVFEPRPEVASWRRDLLDLIAATPNLDWLVLTKRPQDADGVLDAWYRFPVGRDKAGTLWNADRPDVAWHFRDGADYGVLPNLWIGTSIESAQYTWRADWLRRIPAPVRFLSCEPLVGSLYEDDRAAIYGTPDGASAAEPRVGRGGTSGEAPRSAAAPLDTSSEGLRGERDGHAVGVEGSPGVTARQVGGSRKPLDLTGIDWVIIGGESGGRNARPMHPDWALELRDNVLAMTCWGGKPEDDYWLKGFRPALHFKQWGSWEPATGALCHGDVCLSDNGEKYVADLDYVCTPNESDGTWMRYAGANPKSGGKLLDGVEWCEFPTPDLVPA